MNDVVRRNDPFDLFSRFGDLFERDPFFSPANRAEWLPPVDIKETDGRLRVPHGCAWPEAGRPGCGAARRCAQSIRGSRTEEKKEEEKGLCAHRAPARQL